MAYSTVEDVRQSSGFNNSDNIPDEFIEQKIAAADEMIDSYIGDRYTLPLSGTSSLVTEISREIAKLLTYGDEYGEESQDTDKDWNKGLEFWLKLLEAIQKGKSKLRDATTHQELSTTSLRSPSGRPTRISSAPGEPDAPRITLDMKF